MLRKKWISLLVAISMVAAMFPSTVFAASTEEGSTDTEIVTEAPVEKTGEEKVATEEPVETEAAGQSDEDETVTEEETKEPETPAEGTEEKTEEAEKPASEEADPDEETVVVPPVTTPEVTETPAADNSAVAPLAETDEAEEETAEPTTQKVDSAEKLKAAVQTAKDGDSIELAAGTYEIGALTIPEAVSLYGAGMDQTTLVGSLNYTCDGGTAIKIKGLTVKAVEGNTSTKQAINFGNNGALDGAVITVENCAIANYMYGICVNSLAENCMLKIGNVKMTNVWCAASVKEGEANNKLSNFALTEDSTVSYEVQKFASGGENNYYAEKDGTPVTGVTEPGFTGGSYLGVALVDGKTYYDLPSAIAAAASANDKTVTLTSDVYLDKQLEVSGDYIILDLDTHTITASDSFVHTDKNSSHLINVSGQNVTIEEGVLRGTVNSRHGVNVYGGSVTLKDLTVDVTASTGNALGTGIPLTVNGASKEASATLSGNVTLKGASYAANADGKGGEAKLNVADNAQVTFGNDNAAGIYIDGTGVSLDFGENAKLVGGKQQISMPSFGPIGATDTTITGLDNVGIDPETLGLAARVNGKDYKSMDEAIAAVEDANDECTLTLYKDFTLTAPIQVPEGLNLTVEGNGHTITLPKNAPYSAFNAVGPNNAEGLLPGTVLTVNNVNFVGHVDANENPQGHAAVTGFGGDVDVTLDNCSFKDMHDAVYCNAVTSDKEQSNITINSGNFENVDYAYGWDNGYTVGASTEKHKFNVSFAAGSEQPGAETFAEAEVDGKGYPTLEAAIAAAGENGKVTLLKDVKLDSMLTISTKGLTLDLGGHKIHADGSFAEVDTTTNDNHLVDITADNVTITNGTLEAGEKNNHTLNVWNADGVTVSNITLDGFKAGMGGAPLVVGASDVTLEGKVNFVTGANSWYGANVDTRKVGESGTKTPAKLTLGEGAEAHFTGTKQIGIYVENNAGFAKPGKLEIAFEEGSAITTDIDPFTAIVFSDDHNASGNATVTDPENAGLITNEDGNYIVKPAPVEETPSHEHSYVWQGSPDEHWQYCTDCGQVVSNGAHAFQWKDGVQVCSVCGYKVTETATASAPAANANTAAAAPAAGAATTAAATGIPQTGDESNPLLWVVLLAVSGSALGGMVIYKKKKEN